MSIKLRKRKLKNKEVSIYFDICDNGKRWYEFTKIRLLPGSSLKVREYNKQMLEYAEQLQAKLWDDILNNVHGMSVKRKNRVNFIDFITNYIATLKCSKRIFEAAFKKLKEYHPNPILHTTDVNERFLEGFYDHLENTCTGETPITYFKKIQRILKVATKQRLFQINPGVDIKNRKYKNKVRDILSIEDLIKLKDTACSNEEVKKAFLFSCLTGLRFSDIKQLAWSNINGNKLMIEQQKTKERVSIMLNGDALHILNGKPKITDLVFMLPTHTGCLKILHKWVENAAIDKWIGWHNSRHTFGSNLIFNGTDIYITSKLLGHKSLVHTQRYVRDSDELKDAAVNNLPKIFKQLK